MKFSEIPGNQNIKKKLARTVLEQRVSHAQLFFGPEDGNKLALAIAYAQFINCTNKQGMPDDLPGHSGSSPGMPDSCGVCPSCVKYQKLVHPDLHFIYPVATTKKISRKPQSKHFIEEWRTLLPQHNYEPGLLSWYEAIGIENKQGIINAEDCNEIITTLSYKSYESDYKVMIIWMVEKLYHSAAPKILKILEEPPEKTLFLLIAEEPDQIIKTILSRTLMVRIPREQVFRYTQNDEDALNFTTFRQWMRSCFGGNVPDIISFSSDIAKAGREKQKSFLLYALHTIGHCASKNYLGITPAGMEGQELEFINNFSPYIQPNMLPAFTTLLNDAIFHIERNAHPSTLFLNLSLKIVSIFKPGIF